MKCSDRGFVYLWALFAVTVAGVVMAATGQVWQIQMKREKERELLFIGDQFRKAIMSYYNNQITGVRQYPESLEELLEDKRGPVTIRHLRKMYIDPMTMEDEWGVVEEEVPQQQAQRQNNAAGNANTANPAGNSPGMRQASARKGIAGVYSLSNKRPLKKDNFPEHLAKFTEAETYQDWQFVFSKDAGGDNNATRQGSQRGSAGTPASPFGTPGAAGGASGGASTPASPPASPFAPPASGQTGQNPFAR
ncbi:hypothetical protein SAMN05421690_100552 [Nitrosomonas sp. Nm51]|uniref:hypothetical protein n=1 Tax=Nitrosomonas sp. Nm51 TaxID=133720 RepID=UPI0008CE0199|nr:hypothetical protein [Nitrosomonas sp. Nm51]SEQ99685.1 hypothetical protein SAMN05421690_100552 [Nitrosomonas sp. Nm51]